MAGDELFKACSRGLQLHPIVALHCCTPQPFLCPSLPVPHTTTTAAHHHQPQVCCCSCRCTSPRRTPTLWPLRCTRAAQRQQHFASYQVGSTRTQHSTAQRDMCWVFLSSATPCRPVPCSSACADPLITCVSAASCFAASCSYSCVLSPPPPLPCPCSQHRVTPSTGFVAIHVLEILCFRLPISLAVPYHTARVVLPFTSHCLAPSRHLHSTPLSLPVPATCGSR